MKVRFFRDGAEETRTIVIEELPIETEPKTSPSMPSRDGGLTLGTITPSWASRLDVPHGLGGALIVTDATRELDAIERDRPIFLLVWRRGKELFLQMRRD